MSAKNRVNVRRPKRVAILGGLAAATMLMAACSSTSSTTSTSTTTAPSTTTTSVSLSSLLPARIQSSGIIKNGTPEANPPLIFLTPNQSLTGIDYELSNAVGKELGVKFQYTQIPFPGDIPAILSGRIDTSWGIFSDTPQRESEVTFVDYIIDGVTFLTKYGNPENISTLSDLCGKSVGATQGAIESAFITQLTTSYCTPNGKPAITPSLYSSAAASLLALTSGRVAAIVHPGAASQYIASTAGGGKTYQILFPGQLFLANYGGIGVAKGDTQLANALVAALRALQANGTYGKILAKYGLSRMALTANQISLNAASHMPLTSAQQKIYGTSSPYITAK